jgi:hypothetical protein
MQHHPLTPALYTVSVLKPEFGKVETICAKEFEGTYYGKPSNAESLVASAYSGRTFII